MSFEGIIFIWITIMQAITKPQNLSQICHRNYTGYNFCFKNIRENVEKEFKVIHISMKVIK